jgi:Domain of unknown function (DUF3883)
VRPSGLNQAGIGSLGLAASSSIERVGHLQIGFDVRSLGPADPQTGYRDPVGSIRRIEVKGRTKGHPIRLTTNKWYKAAQLGDSYWLYVVWNPLQSPDPQPLIIRKPGEAPQPRQARGDRG